MNRVSMALVAAIVAACCLAGTAFAQVPPAPTLLTPADKSLVEPGGTNKDQVVLTWNASTGATSYYVEWVLPKLHNFTSHVTTVQTSTTITGLVIGDSVAWHVYATNGSGNGPWSATWGFSASGALPIIFHYVSVACTNPGEGVTVKWQTLSEIDSYGFTVQRAPGGTTDFADLPGSFLPGQGTTVSPHDYLFVDRAVSTGTWTYRVKEQDRDGSVTYSEQAAVTVSGTSGVAPEGRALTFELGQNYPNPFNPSTAISYTLPLSTQVRLTVYSVLGGEAATLVDGFQSAGLHEVRFDAGTLASGMYLYRLQAGSSIAIKRMILLK